MFCPKCGAHNVELAKYCRACGADISLVPQALTHALPEASRGGLETEDRAARRKKRRKERDKAPPTLDQGLSNIFKGIAFLLIVLGGYFYFFGAVFFWVWFIIPALGHIGEGLGQIIRARNSPAALPTPSPFAADTTNLYAATPRGDLSTPRDTAEIASQPPPSITEGTTRHLDAAKS